ncbi:MAG TPA: LpxL/LpxP family Kdo(2)-lipid IV(A) lauroyl/palmitoleoyl acyltransferase [Gammaproteobacteria bacterium]|nr:LpxL/LpxP family Kdo(2)-lipid IV(A) lauroyl/palmitoleoyl acyltransferase [Gammaproteobacteria bacterium]
MVPGPFATIEPVHSPSTLWWRAYLAPRFWPTWALFALLWPVTRLPFGWQMGIGSAIGALARRFARRRRHIAEVNIGLCFPELTPDQRRRLLRRHFDALGRGVVETALCWWGREAPLRKRTLVVGREHLQRALQDGRGVLLLSAHFTTLELGGRLLALDTPFHVLYRRHKNPLFERVMHNARTRRFEKAIPRDDVRALLGSLKDGRAVWYAPDQNHGGPQSAFVPFFGVQASTLTTTSRLARLSGAAVVPFFQMRLPRDEGYLLLLCPPLEDFPGADPRADSARINALLEDVIREMPEQYLWVHRRFKTRPPGEAAPY